MKRGYLIIGILILLLLGLSYFFTVSINGESEIVQTPLLGILIFHNPFILAGYILIAVVFIFYGRKNSRKTKRK